MERTYGLDSVKSRQSGDNRANAKVFGRDDRVLSRDDRVSSVGRQRRSRPGDDGDDSSSTRSPNKRRRVGSRERDSGDSTLGERQRFGGERAAAVEDERKEASERRKRSRSGSRSRRRDEDRKRRRRSQEVISPPRSRFRETRTDGRDYGERDRDEKMSNVLQQRINRLKEEIEQAKLDLVTDERAFHSRSTSTERKNSYNRSCRSQSKSLEFRDHSFANHRGVSDSSGRGDESHPQPSMNQFRAPSDDRSESYHERTKAGHSRKKRRSRARSRSLELQWPTNPRHPSTQLFHKERALSPLSMLIASECFQTCGTRPLSFRPKHLRTDLKEASFILYLGQERLAGRALLMKQTNGVIGSSSQDKSLSDFEVLASIGKGSYGQMYKAIERNKETLKALKKMTTDNANNGLPASALQELRLLSRLEHPNITKLLEIITDARDKNGVKSAAFYLVYDYMNHDLKRLLQSKTLQLKINDFAWLIKQLLSALSYCHQIGLVHCDVKPSNVLINNRGDLKLSQFSFACLYDAKVDSSVSSSNSGRRAPMWYRAPELLLGDKVLKPASDIWSCGCIIGEMFSRKPVFLGSDEENQMEVISKACGSPNPSNWPDVASLPMYSIIKKYGEYPRLFHDAFHYMPYMARNLLDKLLVMNPQKRATADESLGSSDWLKSAEFPKMLPVALAQLSDCHLLIPAKLSTESELRSLPFKTKAPVSGYADQIFTGTSGKTACNKFVAEGHSLEEIAKDRELWRDVTVGNDGFLEFDFPGIGGIVDFSDKFAVKSYSENPSFRESETHQKRLVSGLGREFHRVPELAVSEESNQRAFNPRLLDFDHLQSDLRSGALNEQIQLDTSSYGRVETLSRYSDRDDRSQMGSDTRPFESNPLHRTEFSPKPVKIPSASSSIEATQTGIQDECAYSAAVADLERLNMLGRQLEMIGKDNCRVSDTPMMDDIKLLKGQSRKEESAEATRINLKTSGTEFMSPVDMDYPWNRKASYQNEDVSANMAANKEAYQPWVGTERSFRSRPELKSDALLFQPPHTGNSREDNYTKSWDNEDLHAGERPVLPSHSRQQPVTIAAHHTNIYSSAVQNPPQHSSFQESNYGTVNSSEETFEHASHRYGSQFLPPHTADFTKLMQGTRLYGNEMFSKTRNMPDRHYTDDPGDKADFQMKHSRPSTLQAEESPKDSTIEWRKPQSRF